MCSQLDKIEGVFERPSDEVIRELSRALRQALGVSLFGIDIIINNQTGQHAVIDVNAFPGEQRSWVTPFWWSSGCLTSSGMGNKSAYLGIGSRPSATSVQPPLLRPREQWSLRCLSGEEPRPSPPQHCILCPHLSILPSA